MASLVDCLVEAKQQVVLLPDPIHEYNSLTILADELSAFMPLYEPELIGGLTTFYDCVPYAQHRRGKDIRIKIDSPQLNILSGSTPSNLLKFVPEIAWEQGFMSRVIMIYSADRPMINILTAKNVDMPEDMQDDLRQIAGLHGAFTWTKGFADAIHDWRVGGQLPVPAHPKLNHYNSRRVGHLLKLSMVSAVNRGNLLQLEELDFHQSLGWLTEAEKVMPLIFQQGQMGPDAQAMDEIVAYINGHDLMSETRLINYAARLVPVHAVQKIIDVMEKAGKIQAVRIDHATGVRMFKVSKTTSSI